MTTHRPPGHCRVYAWPKGTLVERVDLSTDVLSLQAQRDLDNPVGSFTLVVLPRTASGRQTPSDIKRLKLLYQQLVPNTILSLGVEEDGGIGMGLVNSVRESTTFFGKRPSTSLTIEGSWVGKALAQDSVVYATIAVGDYPTFIKKVSASVGPDNPMIRYLPGVWGPPEPGSAQSVVLTDEKGIAHTIYATRDAVPTFLGQDVQTCVDWILDNAPSLRIPLFAQATGGTGKPSEFISTDFSITSWNDARVWSDAASSYQGSVWAFLQSILDVDFYEMYLEYMPNGGPLPSIELVVRPKPYDEQALTLAPIEEDPGISWETLTTFVEGLDHHDIPIDEVFDLALAYGDEQVYTYYQVSSAYELIGNPESEEEGLAYPLVDLWQLTTYGLRPYKARLTLLAGDIVNKSKADVTANNLADAESDVRGEIREFRNRLFNWYRLNPFFEGGTLTVLGHDRYRPGDPIWLAWRPAAHGDGPPGMRYYCTGVSWSWAYGDTYRTTLRVCRGHNDSLVNWAEEQRLTAAPLSNVANYADV